MNQFMNDQAAGHGIILVLYSFIQVNGAVIIIPSGNLAFLITFTNLFNKKFMWAEFQCW